MEIRTSVKSTLKTLFTGVFCLVFCISSLSYGGEDRKAAFEAIVSEGMEHIPQKQRSWLDAQDLSQQKDHKAIFKQLSAISKCIKKSAEAGALPENIQKNLHSLALPFDATRTLRDKKGFYISASDVLSPEQAYILSQAPIEKTIPDFWITVLEKDVRLIVALAMPHGESKEFPPYFVQDRLPVKVGLWTIEFGDEQVVGVSAADPSQRIVQRTLLAKKEAESRTITHLHYENWKDFGAPDPGLFLKLLGLLSGEDQHPILVHCSAGQGRSGTLVVADSLLKDAKKSPPGCTLHINIPKRIIELRMQRKGLISTKAQLEAVYKAMENVSFTEPNTTKNHVVALVLSP